MSRVFRILWDAVLGSILVARKTSTNQLSQGSRLVHDLPLPMDLEPDNFNYTANVVATLSPVQVQKIRLSFTHGLQNVRYSKCAQICGLTKHTIMV